MKISSPIRHKLKFEDQEIGSGCCNRAGEPTLPFEVSFRRFCKVARQRRLNVSILYEDFIGFTKQTECHYCSGPIDWEPYGTYRYNLDRKDNALGYALDNLVVCCYLCNRIKGNKLSYAEMLQLGPVLRQIMAARHSK